MSFLDGPYYYLIDPCTEGMNSDGGERMLLAFVVRCRPCRVHHDWDGSHACPDESKGGLVEVAAYHVPLPVACRQAGHYDTAGKRHRRSKVHDQMPLMAEPHLQWGQVQGPMSHCPDDVT